jgi:hypothetical protein
VLAGCDLGSDCFESCPLNVKRDVVTALRFKKRVPVGERRSNCCDGVSLSVSLRTGVTMRTLRDCDFLVVRKQNDREIGFTFSFSRSTTSLNRLRGVYETSLQYARTMNAVHCMPKH